MRERSGIEVGEASVSFVIRDEEARFNLALITHEDEKVRAWARGVLGRLLILARKDSRDQDEPSPQELFETLVKWAARGETGVDFKPGGGGLGDKAEQRRFLTIRELLFLKGFTETLVFGEKRTAREEEEDIEKRASKWAEEQASLEDLGEFVDVAEEEEEEKEPIPLAEVLTVWGDGQINVNTAPLILLWALHPQMTEELAEAIDEKRREIPGTGEEDGEPAAPQVQPGEEGEAVEKPGIRSIDVIREIEGIVDEGKTPPLDIHKDVKDYLKVKSEVFRVRVVVKNAQLTQRYEAILSGEPLEPEAEASPSAPIPESGTGGEPGGEEGEEDPEDPPPEDPTPKPGSKGPEEEQGPVERPELRILRVVELD
jgi:type II secretory pathway component PulK